MKLKIMIMALLLLAGIGSAVNWIPESQMEPGTSLTFNGGHVINGTRYVHNIVDYGATPDDNSDDSTAIDAAIAAASAGDTVFFPAGEFHHSTQLDCVTGVTYAGTGPSSIIKSYDGSTEYGFRGSSISDIVMRDLTLDGNGTSLAGIYLTDADQIIVDRVVIQNNNGTGAWFVGNTTNISISDSQILNHTSETAAEAYGILFRHGIERAIISGCKIDGTVHSGVGVMNVDQPDYVVRDVKITENNISNTGNGIFIAGTYDPLDDNFATDIIVTGNTLSGIADGIDFSAVERGVISNNIVMDNVGLRDGSAIWQCNDITVTGNIFKNLGARGILLCGPFYGDEGSWGDIGNHGCERILITGNVIKDCNQEDNGAISGIDMTVETEHATITGNYISGENHKYGIGFSQANASCYHRNNTIVGNNIPLYGTADIGGVGYSKTTIMTSDKYTGSVKFSKPVWGLRIGDLSDGKQYMGMGVAPSAAGTGYVAHTRNNALINHRIVRYDYDGDIDWMYQAHQNDGVVLGPTTHMTLSNAGELWVLGNVSAIGFVDRTPGYTGDDALADIRKIRNTPDGEIDHSTLPDFIRSVYMEDSKEMDGRDIGNSVTLLIAAVQQLDQENQALKKELVEMKKVIGQT
ncbi:MAG: right-handed parallel beta-helix repeat-containing protein [Candidatus Neomarinimicrobiota bacterium]